MAHFESSIYFLLNISVLNYDGGLSRSLNSPGSQRSRLQPQYYKRLSVGFSQQRVWQDAFTAYPLLKPPTDFLYMAQIASKARSTIIEIFLTYIMPYILVGIKQFLCFYIKRDMLSAG